MNKSSKEHEVETKTGKYAILPLEDVCVISDLQTRKDLGDLSALRASLRNSGQLQPIVVRPSKDEDGEYEVVCGNRRVQALQENGEKKVAAIVRGDLADNLDALAVAVAENHEDIRTALCAMDRARLFKRFKDAGLSEKEVAKKTGYHEQTVRLSLRLLDLKPHIVKRAERLKLSPYAMEALAAYTLKEQEGVMPQLKEGDSAARIKSVAKSLRNQREAPSDDKGSEVTWKSKTDINEKARKVWAELQKEPEDEFLQGVMVTFLWVRDAIKDIDPDLVGTKQYEAGAEQFLKTLRGKGTKKQDKKDSEKKAA